MGCINSRTRAAEQQSGEKVYSWHTREKVDPKEYTVEGLDGQVAIRLPEKLNGTPFVVQNCKDSRIYVLDFLSTVSVDDCTNCTLFFGPTKGSVILRNCSNCNVMVACQQFRTRDCNQLNVFLHCLTQPTIENSFQIGFACFSFFYADLLDQFRCSAMSVFNNNWNQVYDFNASDGEPNWCLLPYDVDPELYFTELSRVAKTSALSPSHGQAQQGSRPSTSASVSKDKSINNSSSTPSELRDMQISFDPVRSVVPKTRGVPLTGDVEPCLIIFFADGHRERKSRATIGQMNQNKDVILIHTKEFIMKVVEAELIFESDSYNSFVQRGPLIVLYYSGVNCHQVCAETAMNIELETGSAGLVYVSPNSNTSKRQIELIFNEPNQV